MKWSGRHSADILPHAWCGFWWDVWSVAWAAIGARVALDAWERFPLAMWRMTQDDLLAAGYPQKIRSAGWPDPWRESARIDHDRELLGIPLTF